MKIAIIGANGSLGHRVVKKALDRNIQVIAISRSTDRIDERADILRKSVFDVTREDIEDVDIVFSAYGSGMNGNPVMNMEVYKKYIQLVENSNKRLIAIAGAGSLYVDESHSLYEYQTPTASKRLYSISENTTKGIDELIKSRVERWTVVCPSRIFDMQGAYTGNYIVGANREIIFNEDGKSYLSYDDMAAFLTDLFVEEKYNQSVITVATSKGLK